MIQQFIRHRNMSMKSLQGRRTLGSRDECRTAPVSSVVARWQTVEHSSCRIQGLRSVGETLPCRAQRHGTASMPNCGLQLCPSRHLYKDSKVILKSALRTLSNWCYTNARIYSFIQYMLSRFQNTLL